MRGDLCLNEIFVYHLIEVALRVQQIVHCIKHNLRFREFACALGDAGFDLVVNQQRRFAVKNDLDRPVHTAGNDFGCCCAVATIDRRCAATPHDKAAGDFYVGQRDLAVCNTVADDDEDDEMDDEEDNVRPSDDVTPELETVIDLIEQLRQNRADEE